MAKIGHDADAIAFAKWSVWVKNLKCQKGAKNDSTTTLKMSCGKNCPEKHLLFEKWEHFENGQNWPRHKGYSLCKMVSLGQKLKMPKRCGKRFYYLIKVVMCKKPFRKTPNTRKWEHFENGQNLPRRKGYSRCKMVSLGQKLKMPKRCEKRLYNYFAVVVCKEPLRKTPNIRKMRVFWQWPKLATTQRL